jgi:hypothetical protein
MGQRRNASNLIGAVINSFSRGRSVKRDRAGLISSPIAAGTRFWALLAGADRGIDPGVGVSLPRIHRETARLTCVAFNMPELPEFARFDWDLAPSTAFPWHVVDARTDVTVFAELRSGSTAPDQAIERVVDVLTECERKIAAVAASETDAIDWIRRMIPFGNQQVFLLVVGYVLTGRSEEARRYAAACVANMEEQGCPADIIQSFEQFVETAVNRAMPTEV